jgi:hypothetical protein
MAKKLDIPKRSAIVLGAVLAIVFSASAPSAHSQTPQDKDVPKDKAPKKEAKKDAKPGVSINDPKAFNGYTLVAPLNSRATYLIDMEGRVVHTWTTDCTPALIPYLLDNGNLLRPGTVPRFTTTPGLGGRIQEITWDGKLVWDYTFDGKNQHPHHDITRLPNGNILMIISDRKDAAEVLAAGRRPETIGPVLNADAIIEVKPTGPKSGEIVWEWHVWDHLIQEHDKTKTNFGKATAAPERIDINFAQGVFGFSKRPLPKDEIEKLRALGYLGGPAPKSKTLATDMFADWTHFNSVAYNADLDQIMISVHSFSEIWIIDHSTTTKEAASSKGGKYGKGGDLLYRWGNPNAYRSGTNVDRRFFHQHNAHWIAKGLPGEGHVLVFNNGLNRPDGKYSSVEEIVLPNKPDGSYDREQGRPFTAPKSVWSYSAATKADFFDPFVSGAQRLQNGNTLVCSGTKVTFFEVTSDKEVVWKFVNPSKGIRGVFDGLLGGNPFGGIFRAYRYAPDHPALAGKDLVPGKKIEEY